MNEELYADEMWLIFKEDGLKWFCEIFFWISIFFGIFTFIQILQLNYLKKNLELFEQLFIDKFFNLLKYIIEDIF